MSRRFPLRSVTPKVSKIAPPPDPAQAARLYPDSTALQAGWCGAIAFLRSRPSGSIWIFDTGAPPPKWRAIPKGEATA